MDRGCVDFAVAHPATVRAAAPDNPAFWAAYAAVLEAGPLPVDYLAENHCLSYSGFIDATRSWLRREVATGVADAARLHDQLMLHRGRLAASNTLLDKMIFIATTGMLLPAVNVHMAQRETYETEPQTALLGTCSGRDFWRSGLDPAANVELTLDSAGLSMWAEYAANLRYLDAALSVLRGLREIYEGRASPGPPATPAPYGWSWRWAVDEQALCLDPGYVHASFEDVSSICYEYLSVAAPAGVDGAIGRPPGSPALVRQSHPAP